MFVSRSPQQDPAGPFLQNLCVRVSCARCLRQDLLSRSLLDHLYKISRSGSLQQDPLGPLAQDHCMRTSCARSLYVSLLCISLCQDLCIRILYDYLRNFSVCEPLVKDLSIRTFAPRSCRTTCARSLSANLFVWTFASGPVGPLAQDLASGSLVRDVCVGISVSGAPRATCARSLYANLLCKMSVSRSPQQDLLGALVQDQRGTFAQDVSMGTCVSGASRAFAQDQCMRTSRARCLCQGPLSRTL